MCKDTPLYLILVHRHAQDGHGREGVRRVFVESVDGEARLTRGFEEVVELRLAAQERRDAAVLVR